MLLEKIAVSDEVVSYIAETVDTNVRELEGALTKVVMYSQLKGVACPDIAIAKEALKAGKSQEKGDITGEVIIDTVANYFGVSKAEIIGKKKKKEIVEARMVAVYMVNEALSLPLVSIGQMFGGRDHTTVIHSRDKISEQLKTDANLERKIKDTGRLWEISQFVCPVDVLHILLPAAQNHILIAVFSLFSLPFPPKLQNAFINISTALIIIIPFNNKNIYYKKGVTKNEIQM